jgi:ADP-ribosylglycohydrolase
MPAIPSTHVHGALLGTAVGDALGMPIEGLSHQNVRTYYKGIKEYRDDEKRGDLEAGQWTDDTQMTFALVRALTGAAPADWPQRAAEAYVALRPEARRWGSTSTQAIDRLADGADPTASGTADSPSDGAAMRAAPLGAWWAAAGADRKAAYRTLRPVLAVTHRHPAALAAGLGQAWAVQAVLRAAADGTAPKAFDTEAFWAALVDVTHWAETQLAGDDAVPAADADRRVSERLRRLEDDLDSVPLDLRDLCGGAGVRADEAWPFAVGMFARAPHLLENSLLSAINVGGDADTTGAMLGALLGGLHGWDAFPDEWKDGLEAADTLGGEAEAFAQSLAEAHPAEDRPSA